MSQGTLYVFLVEIDLQPDRGQRLADSGARVYRSTADPIGILALSAPGLTRSKSSVGQITHRGHICTSILIALIITIPLRSYFIFTSVVHHAQVRK